MSRGPGHVMRELEARIDDQARPIVELAVDIYATEQATPSQVESVRRAAHRLAALGRAEVDVYRVMVSKDRRAGFRRLC